MDEDDDAVGKEATDRCDPSTEGEYDRRGTMTVIYINDYDFREVTRTIELTLEIFPFVCHSRTDYVDCRVKIHLFLSRMVLIVITIFTLR